MKTKTLEKLISLSETASSKLFLLDRLTVAAIAENVKYDVINIKKGHCSANHIKNTDKNYSFEKFSRGSFPNDC